MTAQRSRATRKRRGRRLAWLAVIIGILRDHGFQDKAVVGVVVLAALAGLGQESRSRSIDRLLAWFRRLDERAERAIKAPERAAANAVKKAATREG